MRSLIFAINMTLDGCCDHTKGIGSEAILDFFTNLMQSVDLFVYGRITYELMVPFWPDIAKNQSGPTKATNDFAQKFDSINKLVFSRTLEKVEDKNSRVANTNLREEILTLKQEPGKSMLTGGVALPTQLIELGLIDEYYFVVHPVVAGAGRRLLNTTNLQEQLQLKLVESKALNCGSVALHYLRQ